MARPTRRLTVVASPPQVGLPIGFGVELDEATKRFDEQTLYGGAPSRVFRLSTAGMRAFAELSRGSVSSAAGGELARRLTAAGLAHPRPPVLRGVPSVTVVIPVRDRVELLANCLQALGTQYPVLIVDDGSVDPAAVSE